MDKLEKLGYRKYDNHPEPCGPNEWTTQDERYIEYLQEDSSGNREKIMIYPREQVLWISALKCEDGFRNRIPAPLNFDEIKALYNIVKKLEKEYEKDGI